MKKTSLLLIALSVALVPLAAFAAAKRFGDVRGNEWFAGAVENLVNKNIIAGFPDNTFRPNEKMSRAEAAVMFDRLLAYMETENWKTATQNGFSMKYPDNWTIESDGSAKAFKDESGKRIATWSCPIPEIGFEAWDFIEENRGYRKEARSYEANLWLGMPKDASVGHLTVIFMHRNSFSNWQGTNSQDTPYSCWVSTSDDYDGGSNDLFRLMYQSIL